jgi:C_GCAxxG_C_C family probable redox protein
VVKRILDREKKDSTEAEALVERISERARNLYQSHQLLCTEAVVVALNRGLGGGFTDAQAVSMAAPFCLALGESGCLCGALSGAVMCCGLFLGKDRPYRYRRVMRDGARHLHDAFKASNGATCCRVLSKKIGHDKKAHFRQCADLTAEAAELAARLILQQRPELMEQVNHGFLSKRQSKISGALIRLFHYFSHRKGIFA